MSENQKPSEVGTGQHGVYVPDLGKKWGRGRGTELSDTPQRNSGKCQSLPPCRSPLAD